jgi:hypothetical protein
MGSFVCFPKQQLWHSDADYMPESYVGKSVRTRGEPDAFSSLRARRGLV